MGSSERTQLFIAWICFQNNVRQMTRRSVKLTPHLSLLHGLGVCGTLPSPPPIHHHSAVTSHTNYKWAWFQASAAVLMRSATFWDVTLRRLVILYRRFGTTYWPPKVEVMGRPETSIQNCQSTLRKIPEERRSYCSQIRTIPTSSQFCFRTLNSYRWHVDQGHIAHFTPVSSGAHTLACKSIRRHETQRICLQAIKHDMSKGWTKPLSTVFFLMRDLGSIHGRPARVSTKWTLAVTSCLTQLQAAQSLPLS